MLKTDRELLKLVEKSCKRCDRYLDDHAGERDNAYEVIEAAKDALHLTELALIARIAADPTVK